MPTRTHPIRSRCWDQSRRLPATRWYKQPIEHLCGWNMIAQSIEEATGSVLAGVVAAIVATAILGVAKWIRGKWLQRRDVLQLREILRDGRKRIVESQEVFHKGMNSTLPASVLRCAQYNLMIKQLAIALDHRTTNLPYTSRKQVLDALDWYHTDSLLATKDAKGRPTFVIPSEGQWPATEMHLSAAVDRFNKLEAIGWLRLRYRSESRSRQWTRWISRLIRPSGSQRSPTK